MTDGRAQVVGKVQYLSRGQDYVENIARILSDLQGTDTVVHELIQNSDDAPGATRMRFTVTDEALEVWNDGTFERCSDVTTGECEWLGNQGHRCDFHSFRVVGSGDKRSRAGTTGAFGIGFTAVYQLTDRPELIASGERWVVDEMAPHDKRIQHEPWREATKGTTFRLPWATDDSPFRRRLRQQPITQANVADLPQRLRESVPRTMPFLKELNVIEVASGGKVTRFRRERARGRISVISSDGREFRWVELTGNFEERSQMLKDEHKHIIDGDRLPLVHIALPLEEQTTAGFIYATLPTKQSVHLPLLVNAAFYVPSDRKRIKFDDDDPATEWNRAAITAAAELLGTNLAHLPSMIGDQRLAELLLATRALRDRTRTGEVDGAFAAFWAEIVQRLPSAPVVPTVEGGHGSPREVRLWSDGETEPDAAPVLRSVGIDLVAKTVREEWYLLRSSEVGIENLHLKHVVAALEARGLTDRRWRTEDPPIGIDWAASIDKLWRLINTLLSIKDRRDDASRAALQRCAIAPAWDGTIRPVGDVLQLEQDVQDLLADIGVDAAFLDESQLGDDVPDLLAEVPVTTVSQVVADADAAFQRGSDAGGDTRAALLRWLFEQRHELADDDLARVAALPIFPTAGDPRPLDDLALPSNFHDPLALATILELDGVESMRPFFEKLGARPLTLATYCLDFLGPAIENDELSDIKRQKATRWLAKHLSGIRDDQSAGTALRPLPLVPCTDGVWRPGSEVYLSDDLALLVGHDVPIAAIPTLDREAHVELFQWLGAVREPRPQDIVTQCRRLIRGPEDHRQIAEAIIQHVARRFEIDPEKTERDFAALKQIPWLPVAGDRSRGHLPGGVYLAFNQSLFATQAEFVDIGIPVQQRASEWLQWLGLRHQPTTDQVVAHLLQCSSQEQPVGKDIWAFLNTQADDPALDRLREQCCLLLDTGEYVKPTDVYWGWHPFGKWRDLLDEGFKQYKDLLDQLGVAEYPEPSHAVEVLLDIGAKHGGEPSVLVGDHAKVVSACWQLLTEALAEDAADTGVFADLRNAEAVLDAKGRLRKPGDVYFRDSVSLADRFNEVVKSRLIDRPEGMWPALAAAGVRNLSDAVTTRILTQTKLERGGTFPQRLSERHRLLVRVLSHNDLAAVQRLDRFEEDHVLRQLSSLTIRQTVEIDGEPHSSEPFDRSALFLNQEQEFLWVEDESTEPGWLEVGRELVRALGVDGEKASPVASVLKGVLSAESEDEARRELDELGYPALDERIDTIIEPGIATGFGGSDRPTESTDNGDANASPPSAGGDSNDTDQDPEDAESRTAGWLGDKQLIGISDEPSRNHRGSPGGVGSGSTWAGAGEHGAGSKRTRSVGGSTGRQNRLLSYVVPRDRDHLASADPNDEADIDDVDDEVDRTAIAAVLAYERDNGRAPEEMTHEHPGYDVHSEDSSGEVRYIEVKGTAVRWGERGVGISRRQYLEGERERENYWLYVVDRALTEPQVHAIQDPVSQIDQYVFDGLWRKISEQADAPRSSLPHLNLASSPDGLTGAVPVRDVEADVTVGWLSCPLPDRGADWFAVRIEGHGLGMRYRGGIGVVRPFDRLPEEDDRLLMRLHDQTDPDTGAATTVRLWNLELDQDGNQLGVRLLGDAGVPPLTVRHPDRIEVLGEVVEVLDVDELEDLGVVV